jgi:hypothetical protein
MEKCMEKKMMEAFTDNHFSITREDGEDGVTICIKIFTELLIA